MVVRGIRWIGYEEAIVTVSDGTHDCAAFCHPCSLTVGATLTEPLHALDVAEVRLSDGWSERIVNQAELGEFNHRVVARVLDFTRGVVSVGSISIDGVRLPGDVRDGEFVEFEVERLDVIA